MSESTRVPRYRHVQGSPQAAENSSTRSIRSSGPFYLPFLFESSSRASKGQLLGLLISLQNDKRFRVILIAVLTAIPHDTPRDLSQAKHRQGRCVQIVAFGMQRVRIPGVEARLRGTRVLLG